MHKIDFPYFNEISYTDFESFNHILGKKRNELYNRNYELLSDKGQCIEINNIKKIEDGRFNTIVNDIEFECLFIRKNAKSLYVQLSGSRELDDTLPIFKRWSYSSFMDGSVLSIADPMYRKFDKLKLGWYYGTKEEAYCNYIIQIIESIAKYIGIKNENIIFYASSGGGYAALYCATKMEGTTAIVINPQIDLSLYYYSREFQNITLNDLTSEDEFGRNSVIKNMLQAEKSKFILVDNCRAIEDMVQIEKLCKYANYTIKYGLQKVCQNIALWIYDADCRPYHGAQDYASLFWAIDNIRNIFDNIEANVNWYSYLGELWHERYMVVDKFNNARKKSIEKETEIIDIPILTKLKDVKEHVKNILWIDVMTISQAQKNGCGSVYDCFSDNTVYTLKGKVEFCGLLNGEYAIQIRDKKKDSIVYEKKILDNNVFALAFKTSLHTENLVLELRLGKEKSNETKMIVKNLMLGKIKE